MILLIYAKTRLLFPINAVLLNFLLSKNPEKNQHIRMISEGSCDLLKIQLCHHRNKLHLKIYKNKENNCNYNNMSQCFTACSLVDFFSVCFLGAVCINTLLTEYNFFNEYVNHLTALI